MSKNVVLLPFNIVLRLDLSKNDVAAQAKIACAAVI